MVFTSMMKASSRMRSDDVCPFRGRPWGQFSFAFDERFQGAFATMAETRRRPCAECLPAGSALGSSTMSIHAFGDVDRLVADALKIGVDLGDGKNEAQVPLPWAVGMARRSKAISSISRSAMLIWVSPSSTRWQRRKGRGPT